jgi:hypothetical protein
MLKIIYDNLPLTFQNFTSFEWFKKNSDVKSEMTFYNRLRNPKTEDLIFFEEFWGISMQIIATPLPVEIKDLLVMKKISYTYVSKIIENLYNHDEILA